MNIKIDDGTLKRLSTLDLKLYAGALNSISEEDKRIYEELMRSPVEVKMLQKRGICEDELYAACLGCCRRHEKFENLRHEIKDRLMEMDSLQWNLLTVLFDGVYVGEAEDLLNKRTGKDEILYETTGLGTKLAEVKFLGDGE